MKVYKVMFRRSKNKRTVLQKFDNEELAFNYIKNYNGYHSKDNIYIKEETKIINPFKKQLLTIS